MRYQVEIRTSERAGSGTDARVYLSLAGDKFASREAEIDDPITDNDWERGDVNSCYIESADLGDITRGTLRHDGSGAFSDWAVESVKVRNDEDGRTWIASVSTTITRNQPYHLVFLASGSGDGLMQFGGIVGPPKPKARLEPGEEDFRARSVALQRSKESLNPSMTPAVTNVSLSSEPDQLQSLMREPVQTDQTPTRPQTAYQTPPTPLLQRTPTRPQTPTRRQAPSRPPTLPRQAPSRPQTPPSRQAPPVRQAPPRRPQAPPRRPEPQYSNDPGNPLPESELDAYRAQGYSDDQILAMTTGTENTAGNPLPENELDRLRAQGYTDDQILAITTGIENTAGNQLPESELEAYRAQGYTDDQILAMTTGTENTPGNQLPESELDAFRAQGYTDDQILAMRAQGYTDDQILATTEAGSAGNLLPESDLARLRAEGYSDDQIFAMTTGPGTIGGPHDALLMEGALLRGAEGRRLPAQEGQILASAEPESGTEYEGYLANGEPGIRIAEEAEAPTINDSDGNTAEGLSPGGVPEQSEGGPIWA